MADKKVIYKEPASYFSPGMRKAAKEWEAAQKAKQAKTQDQNKGKNNK